MHTELEPAWGPYLKRYQSGEWRAPIFRDLILAEIRKVEAAGRKATLLDIGCGCGFDSDAALQRSLALAAGEYIGIEPDPGIALEVIFSESHRCFFEEAPIEPRSVDIAFAVMVLEHFSSPKEFWDKLHLVLRPGGVFWGFTVDVRHWFASASLLAGRIGIKDLYLNLLHGSRGEERYENYEVFYRSNSPAQIEAFTGSFATKTYLNFHRVGQTDFYFPKWLRWTGQLYDGLALRRGWPGSVMAVRVSK